MKKLFERIDAKLSEMNIKPGKWSAWLDRVINYWKKRMVARDRRFRS